MDEFLGLLNLQVSSAEDEHEQETVHADNTVGMQEDELIYDVFENVVSDRFLQALGVEFDLLIVTFPLFIDGMKGLCR